jgi:hypothetical protein
MIRSAYRLSYLQMLASLLVVGAPGAPGLIATTGYAKVYEYSANNGWQLEATLRGENTGDEFGIGVSASASNTRLIIGAHSFNFDSGRACAYVYERSGDTSNIWQQVGGPNQWTDPLRVVYAN